jgi:hypothetical protein
MIETIILPEALKRERTEVYEGKSSKLAIIEWDEIQIFRLLDVSATVCFIDLGKQNLLIISHPCSKLVKQAVVDFARYRICINLMNVSCQLNLFNMISIFF